MIEKRVIIDLTDDFLKESSDYLVDVSINPSNIINIEIDNDNGVDLNRCVELSRYLESKLNREIEDFELTVGSAGLTSPLRIVRQYKKYEGQEVEVLSKSGIKLYGILKSSDDKGFTIEMTKMEKPEGAKRKVEVKENIAFAYDEVKYTKYKIRI